MADGAIIIQDISLQDDWLPRYTAAELLNLRIPLISPADILEIREDAGTGRVIPETDIIGLRRIPQLSDILEATKQLNNSPEIDEGQGFVVFQNQGSASKEALRRLGVWSTVVQFTIDLGDTVSWLSAVENSDEFKVWLEERVLGDNTGTMDYVFAPLAEDPNIAVKVETLLTCREEEWIDDNVIRLAIKIFVANYGGRFLVIPPLEFQSWVDVSSTDSNPWFSWGFGQKEIIEGTVDLVFIMIHMNNSHWGLACVDFVNKRVLFGDSMDRGVDPDDRIPAAASGAIWIWLSKVVLIDDFQAWDRKTARLEVPQQGSASGSCGFVALNTMERMMGGTVETWTVNKSSYHRLRLMKILTGFEVSRNSALV